MDNEHPTSTGGTQLGEVFAGLPSGPLDRLLDLDEAVRAVGAAARYGGIRDAFAQADHLGAVARAQIGFDSTARGEALAAAISRSTAGTEALAALAATQRSMPDLTPISIDAVRASIAPSPAVMNVRATREVADRLADYQGEVAALVASIKADAAEDRARAERSEKHAKASLRLARWSLAAGILVGLGGIAAAFLAQ